MTARIVVSVDLIQELRLRKWARDHYVTADQRGRNWHPVVLEEMQFRDDELLAESASQIPCSPYVPLAPTETHYLDESHPAVPEPKSLLHQFGESDCRSLFETAETKVTA